MKTEIHEIDGSKFLIKYPDLTEHFGDFENKPFLVISSEIQSRFANSEEFKKQFTDLLEAKNVSAMNSKVDDSEVRKYLTSPEPDITFNYSDFIFRGDIKC